MAELILTQDEQEKDFYHELPDDTIGKFCKLTMGVFDNNDIEQAKIQGFSAGLAMVRLAVKVNASIYTQEIKGIPELGDWLITCKKLK